MVMVVVLIRRVHGLEWRLRACLLSDANRGVFSDALKIVGFLLPLWLIGFGPFEAEEIKKLNSEETSCETVKAFANPTKILLKVATKFEFEKPAQTIL